jgi:hypothetical protein
MRLTAGLLVSFPILLAAASAQTSATFGNDAAEKLFRQSRNAIGGEGAVTNITSLVMKGTVRVSAGDDGPPERAFEIRILLPDQYVRIETAKDWTKRSGFSGGELLTEITAGGKTDRPPANMTAALLRGERGRFARLLLGIASLASPEVWLTLKLPIGPSVPGIGHATTAASARELEATARDNFMARVFYDTAGAPQRIQYEASRRRIVIMFSDRQKVGALLLPHTITTTLDGMPLEEIKFAEIRINAPLTKADFGG